MSTRVKLTDIFGRAGRSNWTRGLRFKEVPCECWLVWNVLVPSLSCSAQTVLINLVKGVHRISSLRRSLKPKTKIQKLNQIPRQIRLVLPSWREPPPRKLPMIRPTKWPNMQKHLHPQPPLPSKIGDGHHAPKSILRTHPWRFKLWTSTCTMANPCPPIHPLIARLVSPKNVLVWHKQTARYVWCFRCWFTHNYVTKVTTIDPDTIPPHHPPTHPTPFLVVLSFSSTTCFPQ